MKTSVTRKTTRIRKLGKAQERRLNYALTTDDLLYRQFRRMQEDLHRAAEAYLHRPQRNVRIMGYRGDSKPLEEMMIVRAMAAPEGTVFWIALPREKKGK